MAGGLRDQLRAVERQTGKRPSQLDAGGEFPTGCEMVWGWFMELCATRHDSNPITFTEMDAFFRMRGYRPKGWEVDTIRSLDLAWLVYNANRQKAERQKGRK